MQYFVILTLSLGADQVTAVSTPTVEPTSWPRAAMTGG
jgi:hypothetical protein